MPTINYPGTPGTVLYGGMAAPAAGTLITTLQLVNTSASELASGFVSPMVGLPLKQGDLPSGEYPTFSVESSGESVAATIYSDTSWPDGSKKFCGVLLRVPVTVSGSGSRTIEVKSGGSAPAASSRSLSDLTAADLSVELTGVTNLSGTWVASLNTAITDATDIVVIGDGPAGKVWRIGGDFKQGGTSHGQLYCWHYVAALQDASGGLLGVRYLGRVAQPWADVTSPTPTRRVFSAVLKSSATTIRTLQGHDTTETVGANIGLPHYASMFTAGTDAKWDYVQGGGSRSADATVRVTHDEVYFIKSRLVPPYDTSVSPTSSSSVDYYPMGRGHMTRNMATTGERVDIGVLPSWAVRHILTGAAVDERACRVNGLASGGWRQTLRRSSTKTIIPVADTSASYTGLGTVQPTWMYAPGISVSGVVDPASNTTLWASETEPSHRPGAVFYPYLMTGEPQYLDMLTEHATGLMLSTINGGRTMTSTLPVTASTIRATGDFGERNVTIGGTTYKGGGWLFGSGLVRVQAWMTRDLADASAIYPDTCPSGTETRKYLREITESGWAAINAYNAALGATWDGSGIYNFDPRTEANNPWCSGYMSNAVCHAASVLPSSAVSTFRLHLARHWKDIAAATDLACAVSYLGNTFDETDTRVVTSGQMLFYIPTTLTFSTSTSRFTVGGTMGSWSPTNGDVIALDTSPVDQFPTSTKPFAEATDRRRLYVVNASGNTAQLSLTAGGSPITVTTDIAVQGTWARLQNFAPYWSAETNNSANDSSLANISACIRHHAAAGDVEIASAATRVAALLTAAGTTYTSDPKNAIAATYPS